MSHSVQNPCYANSSSLLFTVFTAGYNGGAAGIEEVSANGGSIHRVVFHAGHDAVNLPGNCFSSRTGRLAYSADLVSTDNIWTATSGRLDRSEHQVTCLTAPYMHAEEPSWSPNGEWLVYEVANDRKPDQVSIYKIPATNSCQHPGPPTLLVSGSSPSASINQEPNWSPDGNRIVFQRETDFAHGYVNLWMITPLGTDLTRITDDPSSDTDASWSPTSTSIVYSTDRGAPSSAAGANLFVVASVRDGAQVRLTSQCFYNGAPSWSPNGKWVSFETALVPDNNNPNRTAIWRTLASARPSTPSC